VPGVVLRFEPPPGGTKLDQQLPNSCGVPKVTIWIVGLVLFATIGFLTNSWWALLVPLVVWPLYFAGLHAEWWGSGDIPDGWESGLVLALVTGPPASAFGVLARRLSGWRLHSSAAG
jgi:hypothetical protein